MEIFQVHYEYIGLMSPLVLQIKLKILVYFLTNNYRGINTLDTSLQTLEC